MLENVVQVIPDFLHLSCQLVFHGSSQCTEESKHPQEPMSWVNLGCNWRIARGGRLSLWKEDLNEYDDDLDYLYV